MGSITHSTPSAAQMPLAPELRPPLPLETVKAMRRLFDRRWRPWHRCQRFEDAMRDPITARLLELAVTRRRAAGAPTHDG